MKTLFLISVFFFNCTTISFACGCFNDIEEMNLWEYNKYDIIVSGNVIRSTVKDEQQVVKINVKKAYKGVSNTSLEVLNTNYIGNCSFVFEENKEYLFFANKGDSMDIIKPCSRTRIVYNTNQLNNLKSDHPETGSITTAYIQDHLSIWQHEIAFLESITIANGKVKTYYSNKQLTAKGKYSNGVPGGNWVYYYPDGNIKAKGKYSNGLKEGEWTEFFTFEAYFEGELKNKTYLIKNKGIYKNGLKEGEWVQYNPDGSSTIFYYENGVFIREKIDR